MDQKDTYGTPFQTNSGNAPTAGCPIQIRNPDGSTTTGSWQGYAAK